jgi:hypothetical protein
VEAVFTVLLVNSLPLLIVIAVWLLSLRDLGQLNHWRRGVFLAGAAANTLSASVLLAFFMHAQIILHAPASKPVDLDRVYPVFTMMGMAFAAAILSIAGRRVSRWVLALDGVLTVCLWYLAALAASP